MNTNMKLNGIPAPRSGAAAGRTAFPVCRSPRLKKHPKFNMKDLSFCPLPPEDPATLRRAFDAAPQFRGIRTDELLADAPRGLRVVLRCDSVYYATQAAAYLAALADRSKPRAAPGLPLEFEDEFDELLLDLSDEELNEVVCGEEEEDAVDDADCMTVVSPALLDPDMEGGAEGPTAMQGMRIRQRLSLRSVSAPAVLIAAEHGPALSDGVFEQVADALERAEPPHLFLALKAGQLDLALLEELRFRLGFRVCEVGTPDAAYLREVLAAAAAEQGLALAPDLDADAVLAGLRAYRGPRYTDADIDCLMARAAERAKPGAPLGTAELRMHRLRLGRRSAAEALDQMIGLEGVKETLRRALAVQILNARRGRADANACRNLAFCGSPGTGKSVTARLVAQILQDEGCGTGRFVEAGREQLIGAYLGHTSPKISKLFELAAGGVLFIDEAGSLLGTDQDDYANEAVNGLVRHMELHPETMVIFATYEPEMRRLLASNAGLSSRVAGIIRFEDYSDSELCRILALTARRAGEALSDEDAAGCADFFAELRRRKGEGFGNGREARRLFEAAREEMALRCNADPAAPAAVTAADLALAGERLLGMEKSGARARIGF